MTVQAVIAANGNMDTDTVMVQRWATAHLRIAADGGARNAREHSLMPPHVIVGDMDSLDELTKRWLEKNSVERIQYPPAKDETDLELALNYARAHGAEEIYVFGALGGRVDQEMANILLLTRSSCILEDSHYEIRVLSADRTPAELTISGEIGETVSLLSLSDQVRGIEIHGFAYPLTNETLARGTTRGVSNKLTDPIGRIRILEGQLLIIRLKNRREARPS